MSETICGVTLIERDVPGKREVWIGEVGGRLVRTEIAASDYLPLWGKVPYRDFVVAKLLQEAGA